MERKTIIIAGGGYAGLHLLRKLTRKISTDSDVDIRIILIDKNPEHLQKILLFKAIVHGMNLKIPYEKFCGEKAEFINGEIVSIKGSENTITYVKHGELYNLSFDYLVFALGSTVRPAPPERGGYTLANMESAVEIRKEILRWHDANSSASMKLCIAGGGISGIETAADMAIWFREEIRRPSEVILINSEKTLLPHLPKKVGEKIEKELQKLGVRVIHGHKAEGHRDGHIEYSNKTKEKADLCIWVTGLIPNPAIRKLGMPVNSSGRVNVNPFYQVEGNTNIFAIGDAAAIRDPESGSIAGMTCKEAIDQAGRLCKNIELDIKGKQKMPHKPYTDLYCINLGYNNGLVWIRKWGIDILIGGILGAKFRTFTWDLANWVPKQEEAHWPRKWKYRHYM
ncbi:NAD(P)/FAD-dependent oxidoreductase [Peribacillus sp. SCS-155]|uniref:NAD(P)/FAD-dependent oxidoreductase n=1 Tax=Peribacillus sedimenti TaxID=3115297 RepID=UPI0039065D4F